MNEDVYKRHVEGYLVDDMKEMVVNSRNQSLDGEYVVFDIETTGFSPTKNKIIEIGAVKVRNGEIIDRMDEFVNPEVPIPFDIERLTGIDDADVYKRQLKRVRIHPRRTCKPACT